MCCASRKWQMIKREPYIDIVIGPQSYHQINKIIENFNLKKQELTEFDTEEKFNYLDKIKNSDSKVSSFLTIQEGCDKFCSFCCALHKGTRIFETF